MALIKWFRDRFRAALWFYKACHSGRILFSYQVSSASLWGRYTGDLSFFAKINDLKENLDEQSRRELDLYLRNFLLLLRLREFDFALIPKESQEASKLRLGHERDLLKICRKSGLDVFMPESLYYHHGLRSASSAVKQYISNKIFIDGGACQGDSTLVFQQYDPKKVIAFDISERMAKDFHRIMKKNRIPEEKAVLILKGLGESNCEIPFSDETIGSTTLMNEGKSTAEIIPLDSCREVDGTVGFIKLDLEGFGLQAFKGMIETIKRDRPVLAIAVYHNEDELFGIKPLLESLNLNYRIEFKCCSFDYMGELTLFAYPAELKDH